MLRDESVYIQPRSNIKILSQLKASAFVVYWSGTHLSQVWALLLTSDYILPNRGALSEVSSPCTP